MRRLLGIVMVWFLLLGLSLADGGYGRRVTIEGVSLGDSETQVKRLLGTPKVLENSDWVYRKGSQRLELGFDQGRVYLMSLSGDGQAVIEDQAPVSISQKLSSLPASWKSEGSGANFTLKHIEGYRMIRIYATAQKGQIVKLMIDDPLVHY